MPHAGRPERTRDRAIEELKSSPRALPPARKPAPVSPSPQPRTLPIKWIAGGLAAAALVALLIAVFNGSPTPAKEVSRVPEKPVSTRPPVSPTRPREEEKPKEPESVPIAKPIPTAPLLPPVPVPQDPPRAVDEVLRQADKHFEQARAAYEEGKARSSVEALSDATFKAEEAKAKYAAVQEIGGDELKAKAVDQVKLIQQFQKLANESRLAILNAKGENPAASPVPAAPAPKEPVAAIPGDGKNPPPQPPLPPKKTPIPDAPSQKEAEKLIRDLFKEDYKAKAASELQTFAKKLLRQAMETKDDLALKYVLLKSAQDVSVRAGDFQTAMEAIDALSKQYEVNGIDLKEKALTAASKAARSLAEWDDLATQETTLAEEAMIQGELSACERLLSQADAAARKTKNVALMSRIRELTELNKEARRDQELAKKAEITLGANQNDPDGNLHLGRYLCFVKRDWEKGFLLLAKGTDPRLKELAQKELENPAQPEGQIALADAWFGISEKESGLAQKIRYSARSRTWHERVLPSAEGVAKTRIQKRLWDIAKILDRGNISIDITKLTPKSASVGHGALEANANANNRQVMLADKVSPNR